MKTKKTILLVEDDPDDQQLFIEALRQADAEMHCITAVDGQEALNILSADQDALPALIVLDLRMPRFGGEKFLRAIRNDSRYDAIPVIIYTTSRSILESKALKAMGAVHFLSKPNSEEEIYYLVSLMLEEYCYSKD